MRITFASYNIHKAVGLDGRRDPDRILAVLHELNADIVALQECDRRFGERETVLPRQALDEHGWHIVPVAERPLSIGWHGNALLARRGIEVRETAAVRLPVLEPRGAVRADLALDGHGLRVVGMHLDISGVRRRQQVRSVLSHLGDCERVCPAVLMGDLNDWTRNGRALREFGDGWRLLASGKSFPSRRPVAPLDRIVVTEEWHVEAAGVHHSALAAQASDHLPVWARLSL
jgi:endonuclease/exonuclease/phosphatase family metal-dependent hydrolase